MRYNVIGFPVKFRYEEEDWEILTLEELYLKCVDVTRLLEPNEKVDKLLKDLKAVLGPESYNHLSKLMRQIERVKFANECIADHLSPFEARKKAQDEQAKDRAVCYWPDCR